MDPRARSRTAPAQADYISIPTVASELVDDTGAGDAFCGGALVGYAKSSDGVDAILRGSVSASFSIAAIGPAGLVDAPPEVAEQRLAALGRRVETAPVLTWNAHGKKTRNTKEIDVDHEKQVMLLEIGTQPGFVRDNIDSMLASMRGVLDKRDPGTIRHGFIIGCGDSYCAGLAARSYMMEATDRFVEPVEALEFSRYLVSRIPDGSFVFGVSNSGTVSRTIEGVALARERGAWTFAVTVSEKTRLAEAAETLIKVNATPNIKERPDGTRVVTPGSVTYTASMLGLFVASIAFGERVGTLDAGRSAALVADLRAAGGSDGGGRRTNQAACPRASRRPSRQIARR